MIYFNVYLVDLKFANFVIKSSKSEHKNSWFQKTFTIFFVSLSHDNSCIKFNDIILKNYVIIHNSSNEIVKFFTCLVNNYFEFWIDQSFADLFINNWMRISLKSDWKKIDQRKSKNIFVKLKTNSFSMKLSTIYKSKTNCLKQLMLYHAIFLFYNLKKSV